MGSPLLLALFGWIPAVAGAAAPVLGASGLLILAGLAGLAPGCGDSAHEVGAGLRCTEPEVDFGTVWEGAVLEHEFELDVDAALRLESARPTCGCTLARIEVVAEPGAERVEYDWQTPLPSGSKLFVGVRYDTRGKRGEAPQRIDLVAARTELPEASASTEAFVSSVHVQAVVRPWLVADPDHFPLQRMSVEESRDLSFSVHSSTGEAFDLKAPRVGLPDAVGLELEPVLTGLPGPALGDSGDRPGLGRAARWQVRVRLGPGLPKGTFAWPLRVQADVAKGSDESASYAVEPLLSVQVVGAVYLDPPNLDFGRVAPGELSSRTLRVRVHDPGTDLAEPSVRLEPARGERDAALVECAVTRVRPAADGGGWEVELVLDDPSPLAPGLFLGHLVVETAASGEPELRAAVSGYRMGETAVHPAGADR